MPVRVTGTVAPCAPLDGLMELSVGNGGRTVKVTTWVLVPPGVVTATLAAPIGALLAMLNVVVIVVELTTVQGPTVMPILTTPTVQVEAKLVPEIGRAHV